MPVSASRLSPVLGSFLSSLSTSDVDLLGDRFPFSSPSLGPELVSGSDLTDCLAVEALVAAAFVDVLEDDLDLASVGFGVGES